MEENTKYTFVIANIQIEQLYVIQNGYKPEPGKSEKIHLIAIGLNLHSYIYIYIQFSFNAPT